MQDVQIDVCAILNDTTGTLMSCAWKNHNCKIGAIVGMLHVYYRLHFCIICVTTKLASNTKKFIKRKYVCFMKLASHKTLKY